MLTVDVVWVDAAAQVQERVLHLPPGACLQDALRAGGLAEDDTQVCGIWGRAKPRDAALQDGDRVELYQPLKVDPKVARRERFAQQGARSAGLFASRRANSKAGY